MLLLLWGSLSTVLCKPEAGGTGLWVDLTSSTLITYSKLLSRFAALSNKLNYIKSLLAIILCSKRKVKALGTLLAKSVLNQDTSASVWVNGYRALIASIRITL
jgi:hypothetical protein